jgi:hypothetical protein
MSSTKIISMRLSEESFERLQEQLGRQRLTMSQWLFLAIQRSEHYQVQCRALKPYIDYLDQQFSKGRNIDGDLIVKKLQAILDGE